MRRGLNGGDDEQRETWVPTAEAPLMARNYAAISPEEVLTRLASEGSHLL
jgi:hypothetical protein